MRFRLVPYRVDKFWSDQEVLYDYNADLHMVTSICDLTSISRIQRPLKACFRLLHDDDDDHHPIIGEFYSAPVTL